MRQQLSILFLLNCIGVFAQEETPELVTDRPDQTESSSVVPHKSLQIETGFVLENKETDEFTQKGFAYNTTLLRYGLLTNFELRLGMAYLGEEIESKISDTTASTSGLSPFFAGFKVMVTEEEGWKPEVALLVGLDLPFTAQKEFAPEYTGLGFRFALSHTLSDRFSIGYNLGAQWNGDNPIPGYYYSFALGIGITEKLGAYIESFGLIPEEGDAEHLVDAGFTFLAMPNLQFDLSGGLGLNEETIDNYFSIGLSYRLPQ